MSAWNSSAPVPVDDDCSWDDDLEDAGAAGSRGGDAFGQGWLAGANATRCSCPGVVHPRSCGSHEGPPSWGQRLRRLLLGGDRR